MKKKFTFMMLLMLVSWGVVKAQTLYHTVSGTSGFYTAATLKAAVAQGETLVSLQQHQTSAANYINSNGGVVPTFNPDGSTAWAVEESGTTDQYVLKNVATQQYIQQLGTGNGTAPTFTNTKNDALKFNIVNSTANDPNIMTGYKITDALWFNVVGNGNRINSNGANNTDKYIFQNNGAGIWTCFWVYPVKVVTAAQLEAAEKAKNWRKKLNIIQNANRILSNAKQSNEGTYEALLDYDKTTFFHSQWSGNMAGQSGHDLQFALPTSIQSFIVHYMTRTTGTGYPTAIRIDGSNNSADFTVSGETNWTTGLFTKDSGLPTGASNEVMFPVELSNPYKFIRFVPTHIIGDNGRESNWFCLAEFHIYPNTPRVQNAFAKLIILENAGKLNDISLLDANDVDDINSIDQEIDQIMAPYQNDVVGTISVKDVNGTVLVKDSVSFRLGMGDKITTIPDKYNMSAFYDYNVLDETISETNKDFVFTATFKANPYIRFGSDFSNVTWYNFKIRGKYMSQNDQATGGVNLTNSSTPFKAESSWGLIGNPYDGFVVVNKKKGDGNYLTYTDIRTVRHQDNNIKFEADANKVWILEQNNCSNYPGGFVLRMKENPNIYFHHENSQNYLRTCSMSEWSLVHNDEGSTIVPTTDDAMLFALYNNIQSINFGNDYGQYEILGMTNQEYNNKMNTVANAIQNNNTPVFADCYATLLEIQDSASLVMPKAGEYMRIQANAMQGYYLSNYTSTERAGRAAFEQDATSANTIYYFDGTNLINYGNGQSLKNNANFLDVTATGDNATSISFHEASAKGLYNIQFVGNNNGKRSLFCGNNNAFTDGANAGQTGSGYDFILEKVTTLPIAMTDLSSHGAEGFYGTFYAPVDVKISGAQVYTTNLDGEYLKATEVTSGEVPAHNGVILKSTTDAVQASVIPVALSVSSTNLQGTVRTIPNFANSMVLSIVGGNVGFYSFNGDELKGGKAFYVSLTPVQGYKLDFGGTATGIGEAITGSKEHIFDLSGRRVEKATKGVYIVGGKKVVK